MLRRGWVVRSCGRLSRSSLGSRPHRRRPWQRRPDETGGLPLTDRRRRIVTETSARGEPGAAGAAWTLPELGPRGEGWVALQVVLLAAMAATGIRGRRWPASTRALRLLAAGPPRWPAPICSPGGGGRPRQTAHAVSQARRAGEPEARRRLRARPPSHLRRGPAARLAWSLVSSPSVLAPWAVAAVFLDAKRRREESWLGEEHPEYEAYRTEVRRSLVPYVW